MSMDQLVDLFWLGIVALLGLAALVAIPLYDNDRKR